MEKIKEELNNLINLYKKRNDIEKLTKNIEEKKKQLEKLDNKVKLEIDVQLKSIAQKELEVAQKEFEKMQKDKKTQQEELSKKFENYKKSLELVIDEELKLKNYKTKSQLDDLKSLKDSYEKNANDAEKTVKRLINDLTEGKRIDESMLVDEKNKVNVNRELATEIQKEIEKKLKNYTEIESDIELYSDLTYLKLRIQTLSLEQLNENTEKDFYEKYFQDKKTTEQTKSKDDNQDNKKDNEKIETKEDKPNEPQLTEQQKREMVEAYLALEEKNVKAYIKLRDCLQHAWEFKGQDNNKAGKISLENAQNYEKNIEKYENQLLEMAEKVDPYLNQEDINKIIEYGNNKKAIFREIREIKEKILNIGTQEQSNPKIPEPKDPEPTKPNNNEKQKDVNNLHFYANLKETKFVIKYTLDKDEQCDYVNYQAITKWGIISEALQKVYPEIDFASEDGQQELKKYEDADPNLVKVLSNNKNRLEEYIALLNGEKKIDVNDKNALKITYDIRKLSKCELSKKEKEAIEDYAFKHRDIAEVKKNALQSIKFKFREMKEKRENKKAVKALKSGKIVTPPVKDGISSEAKDTITKMVDDKNKRAKNIDSMDQFILSDEEKQKLKEEKDKRIKEEKQRQDEERIKWQIENISKKIENATSNEEKVAYQKLLKEKLDEQAKLNKTKIDNTKKSEKDSNDIKSEKSKSEEQIEPEKPKADEQKDELKKPTSNWRDSMKVEPKIETTAQEQETPTETPINNEKNKKEETGNSANPTEPKKSDDLIELIKQKTLLEQKLNDLPKDDENRNGLEIVLKTLDGQISEIHQKNLNESVGVKKDIVKGIEQRKKSLEDKIASMPEGRNKEIYREAIGIMDKNIQELESIISDDIKKSGEKPDKREDR